MRSRRRLATICAAAVMVVAGGPVASGAEIPWAFTCSGPVGTPSTFTALHENSNGVAFRDANGTVVFVGMVFEDLTAGKRFSPPGAMASGVVTATCTTVNPFNSHALRIGGWFVP